MTGTEAAEAQAEYVPIPASECCEGMPLHCVGDCAEVPISSNPKDIAAAGKCPLWLVPPVAEHVEARVLEHGAAKYGAWNWRREKILLSNYISALKRHLAAFVDGEDVDPESGILHLGHARATLGIILDAMAHDCVIDDRPR